MWWHVRHGASRREWITEKHPVVPVASLARWRLCPFGSSPRRTDQTPALPLDFQGRGASLQESSTPDSAGAGHPSKMEEEMKVMVDGVQHSYEVKKELV